MAGWREFTQGKALKCFVQVISPVSVCFSVSCYSFLRDQQVTLPTQTDVLARWEEGALMLFLALESGGSEAAVMWIAGCEMR